MKHFLTVTDATRDDFQAILKSSFVLRCEREAGEPNKQVLAGKSLAMIFEKPSLRTRVSFEQAIVELGGHAIVLSDAEIGMGKREAARDVTQVLAGMVHGVIARVFEHQKLIDLAKHGSVPVINALSDEAHPVQVLADAMTIMDEFGREIQGRKLAFIGDGYNVARSVAAMCGQLDMRFVMACPPGYELPDECVSGLRQELSGLDYAVVHEPTDAVRQADVIYTDTWVSMGQEDEKQNRLAAFANYQVNDKLMDLAQPHAIVLHCLPAHRGYEISNEVMDGHRSRVFPQAHNRLHSQKGLLATIYE